MHKTVQFSLLIILASGLASSETVVARGFGGFHGGGGGLGGSGARLGGGGLGGGGARLGGGGLGGGSFAGAMRSGGVAGGYGGGGGAAGRLSSLGSGVSGLPGSGLSGIGGGQLGGLGGGEFSGLRSQLGGGGSGRLQSLEGRLQGSGGGTNPIGNLSGNRLSGLGNGALSGKRPTDNQLSKFLGIPSDNGLHNLSGETQSKGSQIYDKMRQGDGPLSNRISGETQSKGSQIYDKMKQGDGPFKNFIPGETQKPLSRIYDSVRAGNHPLRPWSPWRIHNNAINIRRDFNNYFIFTPAWYRQYPAAWYPPAWYDGDPWMWAPWPTVAGWCGYPAQPMYYDYGSNVVYQDDSVVVNGTSVGTPTQYAEQAQQLASSGVGEAAADAKQWMSLGVFAVSEGDQQSASMVMQLAIDKQGGIRGNYTNTSTKDTQVIHGAVDKKTQRAAWTIGDNKDIVLDTGIYNLTKDETPVLVHEPDGQAKQWLMVRIQKKDGDSGSNGGSK